MSMFNTYQNLQDNYVPNNMQPCPPNPCWNNLKPACPNKPYEDYNEKGELIGYWWNYGDILNLEFNIVGQVTVADDAIIYTAANQTPLTSTVGFINQKAYNIIDQISWTCTAIDSNQYTWTQDIIYQDPPSGNRNIYISAQDFLASTQVTVQLFNFRMEQIAIQTYNGSSTIIFPIDQELSQKLVKGIYYCSLTVWQGDTLNQTLLSENDLTLSVR